MSATEEISRYFDVTSTYYSPTLNRKPVVSSYDFPEKSQKKDKKWSIGSLFRRKKKNDSDSSSEEGVPKKGFLRKKRKPTEKRKKPVKLVGTFDHVVLPPQTRNLQIPAYNVEDYSTGVLSDPTSKYSYSAYTERLPTSYTRESRSQQPHAEREGCRDGDGKRSPLVLGHGSLDNLGRRSRRELTKARVEALRDLKYGSSSDEDSQRSHSSSRFRSDDSLTRSHRDGSLSRRSRAARTERYIRRLSKDEENVHRISNSDAAFYRKPSAANQLLPERNSSSCLSHSSFSGLSTVPHNHKLTVSNSCRPMNSSSYHAKRNLVVNSHVPCESHLSNRRSVSYDGHIHSAIPNGTSTEQIYFASPSPRQSSEAIGVYSNIHPIRTPPPPPPRDPRRLAIVHHGESGRPTSYSFERGRHGFRPTFDNNANELGKTESFQWNTNCRSTSEDNLPSQPIIGKLPPRPSSTTPETDQQRFAKRHPENTNSSQSFQYLTDKNPRSRKPIFICANNTLNTPDNDDSRKSISQKSLEFWKQRDQEEFNRRKESTVPKSGSSSPQMFTSQTRVRSKVFLPDSNAEVVSPPPNVTEVKPISVTQENSPNNTKDDSLDDVTKRKSTNLEEALDELEAIYNSLRLGDEDLLERAEQREMSAAAERLIQSKTEAYPNWNTSLGTLSDSSYSYEPFETADLQKRKRMIKRSRLPDRKADDMAFRKLNKERFATISDPQSVVSKVSYLLATPAYDSYNDSDLGYSNKTCNEKEPDITLDDVVYRTIKHANNTLKVPDPQPPFGIPLGPVSPAANSDYLHAVPDPTPTFVKNQKIPDIVKDDLAFRNLRKDENKEPALPPLTGDDIVNNNARKPDLNYIKKKRAMRSLSANISNLVDSKTLSVAENTANQTANDSNKSLTDIADVMEFARQVLREKENKISATRAGFLSDTETNKIRYKLQLSNRECPQSKRLSFLNELRYGGVRNCDNEYLQHKVQVTVPSSNDKFVHSRPPRRSTVERKARSPTKESTPIPLSPLEEKLHLQEKETKSSSIDKLLKAIAAEAKETSDRIASTLTSYKDDSEKPKRDEASTVDETDRVKNKGDNEKDERVDVDIKLSDLDETSSDHAKMCKKLLECVADTSELKQTSPAPETTAEQSVSENSNSSESKSDIVVEQVESTKDVKYNAEEKAVSSESEHDYENISEHENDTSPVVDNRDVENKSGPESNEKTDDLKEVNNDKDVDVVEDSQNKPVEREDEKGETCVGVLSHAALSDNTKECAFLLEKRCMDVSNKIVHIKRFRCSNFRDVNLANREACSKNVTNKNNNYTSTPECASRHTLELQSSRYYDPLIIAIACVYGLACIHQLASVSLLFVLSIVFAILAVVVSLIL